MKRAKRIRESQKQAEHHYGEAFHLMQYKCFACGHEEVIWNSRNGVTPFSITCTLCGQSRMNHVNWSADVAAPDHQPKLGDMIFVGKPDEPRLVTFDGKQVRR